MTTTQPHSALLLALCMSIRTSCPSTLGCLPTAVKQCMAQEAQSSNMVSACKHTCQSWHCIRVVSRRLMVTTCDICQHAHMLTSALHTAAHCPCSCACLRLINPQTMMLGQEPRQTTSNLGHLNKPSIQALIHGLNRHYYSIAINYRQANVVWILHAESMLLLVLCMVCPLTFRPMWRNTSDWKSSISSSSNPGH